jgi:glutamate dehydrogenase (NADP+)
MLETKDSFAGKTVVVSGSGNVALNMLLKSNSMGGKVVTMSDSGYIYDADGIDAEKLAHVEIKKN